MMLLHPAALLGMIAAITPVAIYLILRRRKKEIAWGAGYLLRLALASKKKSSLWRQFVILGARCLILALAGLLIAQPFMTGAHPSSDTPALPDRPVHRVVLFDNSRSMIVTEDNLTRLDRARAAAGALLRSQRGGDTLDVIPLISAEPAGAPEPVTFEGAIDENHVQHAMASIPVRHGAISLEPALATAMTRLATTPGSVGEIYLLSDFPRELERQVEGINWFAPLARERGVRIAPVNMIGAAGDSISQNVSIDAVTLGSDLLVAGVPTRLYVDASNHSDREVTAVFEVSSNIPLKQQTVRLNADEQKRVAIPLTLPAGNGQVLKISVRPSRLATQGTRHLSVDVKDALDVWLVADEKDPAEAGDGEPDDAEFLQRAIKQHKDQTPGVRLKAARMNDLTLPIPESVDAIMLVGPRYTTPAINKPLTDFVRRGGGLLVTASPSIQLPAFNENLGALLPAPLDKPMREKVDVEAFFQAQLEPAGVGRAYSALFDEFGMSSSAAAASDLSQARFYNHYRLKVPADLPGVILRLSNGDPLLVEKQIGRGLVMFDATTLGVKWTSLPVRQSFIPLIMRTLGAAVAGRTLPLNFEPGATVVANWPAKATATLTLPDQSTKPATVLDAASGQFVVLDNLREPGLYTISDGAGKQHAFTIAGGSAEADLRSLPEGARAKLATALGAEVFADWGSAVKALGPVGARQSLWPWLLGAMLALYLFETWFVRTL